LATLVELILVGDVAERQGFGDGVERGLGDGDADRVLGRFKLLNAENW
jgi:hypothetical protein